MSVIFKLVDSCEVRALNSVVVVCGVVARYIARTQDLSLTCPFLAYIGVLQKMATYNVAAQENGLDSEDDSFLARDYQEQLLETARNQNTILYLPTGSGKTYIAVMLIKAKLDELKGDLWNGGKCTVFMVNTVPLVVQQGKYIARFVPVNVGMYSGDMNVDVWNKSKWNEELRKNKVLVMTCQIFLDMLLHGYITLADVNLLIFDECHHAVEDQPMRQVMSTFQDCENPPRVLGLTATLLNSSVRLDQVQESISSLERTFHGTIATVDDLSVVERFSTNPDEFVSIYKSPTLSLDETPMACHFSYMKDLLRNLRLCTDEDMELSTPPGSNPMKTSKKTSTSKLINELEDIIIHLKDIGLYGSYKATIIHTINVIRLQRRAKSEETRLIYDSLLTFLKHMMFSSPKLLKLIDILRTFNNMVKVQEEKNKENDNNFVDLLPQSKSKEKPFCALIFVKRRATSQILYNIIKDLANQDKNFEHIRCDFIVGYNAVNTNNPFCTQEAGYLKRLNDRIIKRYNQNEINVLFSTSVLEEGIDIPQCNMVVKFDYPENYRSYVQSKGRARHKTSQYYMMVCETDQRNFTTKLSKYRAIEQALQKLLVGRTKARQEPKEADIESELYEQELDPYYVDGPGSAKVTQTSAISLVNRYCSSLPQDKFTVLAPYWYLSKDRRTCILQLPINCPVRQTVEGKPMNSRKMAKRSVALKMCELLHRVGELNDHLLPVTGIDWSEGLYEELLPLWDDKKDKPDTHLPGTKKMKRQYLQKFPDVLSECRPQPGDPAYLHVLRARPVYPRPPSSDHRKAVVYDLLYQTRDFAILSSKPLYEVCKFPIFMNVGELQVEVISCARKLTLSPKQVEAAKNFNCMIFMDLVKVCKPFMIVDNEDKEQCYYVVPSIIDGDGLYDVDWDVVFCCMEIPPIERPSEESQKTMDISKESLELKVIVPWYRGSYTEQFYIVTKVDENLTTLSKFPTADYSTYQSYFKKKYDLTIFRPEQPMLEVKSISNKIQFLKPRKLGVQGLSKRKRQELQDDFEENLVPELCQRYEFPSVLWLKATCLPTILHRLTYLLLAEELRRSVNLATGVGCVSLPRGHQWEMLKEDCTVASNNSAQTPAQPLKVQALSAVGSMVKALPLGGIAAGGEPIDIYREDEISLVDVLEYDEYMCKSLNINPPHRRSVLVKSPGGSESFSPHRVSDTMARTEQHFSRNIAVPVLKMLEVDDDFVGPQLCHVFQAICTSSANDIVNLERLETLGDSFLKLSVSLYLFAVFPKLNEGKLTQLKGKIVGNRYLFYCGRHIGLPRIMKVHDFAPMSDWVPPGFCVLRSLQEVLRLIGVSPNILYDLSVPRVEQRAGFVSDEIQDEMEQKLLAWDGEPGTHSSMEAFLSQRSIVDKAVADSVEALIGTYLQSNGLRCALEVVRWLRVLPYDKASPEFLFDSPPAPAKLGEGTVEFHLKTAHLLEQQLQYSFRDRAYLLQALTHPSYITNTVTECYQRLEFIGDAILDFLITSYIYEYCGNLSPGEVTDLRSALVNNVTFASLAARNGFQKYMLFSSVHLMDAIDVFVTFQEERNHVINDEVFLLLSEKDIMMAEAVEVPKALGDVFESIAGAIYLDSGKSMKEVWRVYYGLMQGEIEMFSKKIPKQPTRMLYESVPNPPVYLKPRIMENQRAVCVPMELFINNKKEIFFGFGENKIEGKRAAAKLALRHLFAENRA
ncbi:endoribonuclease Dicer-like isoform X2 [Bacillus rossius redtenbacheri]|uniref:endoribonuclease Dicer-like isoform X2 n=1 Tax=Bacillus rossius redtenbacheri TaxID=93214 RepID=UPI002FDC9CE3